MAGMVLVLALSGVKDTVEKIRSKRSSRRSNNNNNNVRVEEVVEVEARYVPSEKTTGRLNVLLEEPEDYDENTPPSYYDGTYYNCTDIKHMHSNEKDQLLEDEIAPDADAADEAEDERPPSYRRRVSASSTKAKNRQSCPQCIQQSEHERNKLEFDPTMAKRRAFSTGMRSNSMAGLKKEAKTKSKRSSWNSEKFWDGVGQGQTEYIIDTYIY